MPETLSLPSRWHPAIAALVVLLTASACSGDAASQATGGFVSGNGAITLVEPGDREPAPALAGDDLEGNPVASSDYTGKTVVVNVWGSWCTPCREEAPELAAASAALQDEDVQFLGINIRDEPSAARAFEARFGITYPSIDDPSSNTLLGFAASLPASAVPTTFVIDDQGRVAARILDATTRTTLIDLVDDVQDSTP